MICRTFADPFLIGVGKTSLLNSIIRVCNHIIHVDPAVPTSTGKEDNAKPSESPSIPRSLCLDGGMPDIVEVYASTKRCCDWTDSTDLNSIHVCSHNHDLERNICFVDTPGYSATSEVACPEFPSIAIEPARPYLTQL